MSSIFQDVIQHIDTYYPQTDNEIECELCCGSHLTSECQVPQRVLIERLRAIERLNANMRNTIECMRGYRRRHPQLHNLQDINTAFPRIVIYSQIPHRDFISCGICFENNIAIENSCEFQCTHTYCKPCVLQYVSHSVCNTAEHSRALVCPMCRALIETIIHFA